MARRSVLFSLLALGAAVVLALAPRGASAPSGAAGGPVPTDTPQRPDWRTFIVAPAGRDLLPKALLSVEPGGGSVTHAERATDPAAPPLRLESPGENGPVLTLDFGQVVSGKPELAVLAASSPPPAIRLSFSEAREFLAPGSDTQDYGTGDLTYAPETAGVWTAPARRSFRYLRLALASPGWVELERAGLYFTAHLGGPEAQRGYFVSSDDLLNRIWAHGVYTLDLVTAPGSGSVCDGHWELVREQLHGWDCGARRDILTTLGAGWTDLSAEFDITIVPGGRAGGWLLRAGENRGYRIELLPGEPGRLRRTVRLPDGDHPLPDVTLPAEVRHGQTYRIGAEARGARISTRLDGRLVDSFEDAQLPEGHFGFHAGQGANFFAAMVTLRDGSGAILLEDDFTGRNPPVPDCVRWAPQGLAPRQWAPLCGPSLLDGAKRDRAVSAADVVIAGRTTYASTFRADVARSALHHLAYALLPPPTALHEFPMWWVIALRDYQQYTGDDAYVRTVLHRVPEILDEALARRDARGLLSHPPGCDHIDWYWTVCSRSGAVTSVNAATVGGLEAGAALLAGLGDAGAAGRYREAAGALRTAMAPLWDGTVAAWADSDVDRAHHPLDGNSLTVLFGVQPERDRAALDWIRGRLWTPWGSRTAESDYGPGDLYHDRSIWAVYMYHEVLARFGDGDDAGALDVLRRGWGNFLARDPASTFWEWAGPEGQPPRGFASLTHGWSTGAVDALTGEVLGVRPAAPGFRAWTVRPHPGDLAWAEGRVPTPGGAIEASWERDAETGTLRIAVTAPEGATGVIAVPKLGRERISVWLDDAQVWDGSQVREHPLGVQSREAGGYVEVTGVPGGRHVVTSAAAP